MAKINRIPWLLGMSRFFWAVREQSLWGIMRAMRELVRPYLLPGATLLVVAGVSLLPAIPQDLEYHSFADRRSILGVPHFWNVFSNLPFLLVGIYGLAAAARARYSDARERTAWLVLFIGVTLTCFGSSYYHLDPSNQRLVWDRLPMTIGSMGFFAATLSERVNLKLGLGALPVLLLLGAASVGYWHFTEQAGRGDLRPYVVVQFFPLLLIPLLIWAHPARYTRGTDIVVAIVFYGSAKLFELLDAQIYSAGGLMSGHAIKHVAAAMATLWLARMLAQRQPASAAVTAAATA